MTHLLNSLCEVSHSTLSAGGRESKSNNCALQLNGVRKRKWENTHNSHTSDTHLQIYLQTLVINLCLKSDEMELLCDDQWGLEKKKRVFNTPL